MILIFLIKDLSFLFFFLHQCPACSDGIDHLPPPPKKNKTICAGFWLRCSLAPATLRQIEETQGCHLQISNWSLTNQLVYMQNLIPKEMTGAHAQQDKAKLSWMVKEKWKRQVLELFRRLEKWFWAKDNFGQRRPKARKGKDKSSEYKTWMLCHLW